MTMSPETRPEGQQNGNNPLQEARHAFNSELLGRDYHPGILLTRTLQLHQALLRSGLSPERVYHESIVMAGQAAQKAELFGDTASVEPLQEMRRAFELTYETFNPKMSASEAVRAAQPEPTKTEDLPPMTSAKGGEPLQTQTRSAQTQTVPSEPPVTAAAASEEEQPAENPVAQPEETFGSFLRQRRTEARLSQAKLGEAAGYLTNVAISALERGVLKSLDEAKARQIASALGLNPEDTERCMELYRKQFATPPETSQQ